MLLSQIKFNWRECSWNSKSNGAKRLHIWNWSGKSGEREGEDSSTWLHKRTAVEHLRRNNGLFCVPKPKQQAYNLTWLKYAFSVSLGADTHVDRVEMQIESNCIALNPIAMHSIPKAHIMVCALTYWQLPPIEKSR